MELTVRRAVREKRASLMRSRNGAVGFHLDCNSPPGPGEITRYCRDAPIATGLTGEPAFPCARSGRMMVHDSHTLS